MSLRETESVLALVAEIESLRQQLSEAYEAGRRDASADLGQAAFEKWLYDKCPSGDDESVQRQWLKSYEHAEFAGKMEQAAQIESLRQQLAAAIAACELKDESLEAAHNGLRWWMDAFPLHVTEADNEEMLKIVKALAIRPGTEALEKWLGEPVAIIGKHGHPKHISAIPSIEENRLYGPFEPLYAKPKGLK